MSAPTRASTAGRAYLDLRKLARENHRHVDELLQLYVLEAFLEPFGDVVATVIDFADPAILGSVEGHSWEPTTRKWS